MWDDVLAVFVNNRQRVEIGVFLCFPSNRLHWCQLHTLHLFYGICIITNSFIFWTHCCWSRTIFDLITIALTLIVVYVVSFFWLLLMLLLLLMYLWFMLSRFVLALLMRFVFYVTATCFFLICFILYFIFSSVINSTCRCCWREKSRIGYRGSECKHQCNRTLQQLHSTRGHHSQSRAQHFSFRYD